MVYVTRLVGVIATCTHCHKRMARWIIVSTNRPVCDKCLTKLRHEITPVKKGSE